MSCASFSIEIERKVLHEQQKTYTNISIAIKMRLEFLLTINYLNVSCSVSYLNGFLANKRKPIQKKMKQNIITKEQDHLNFDSTMTICTIFT